eukprot:9483439-Pyramimonas_sp.AAC.1
MPPLCHPYATLTPPLQPILLPSSPTAGVGDYPPTEFPDWNGEEVIFREVDPTKTPTLKVEVFQDTSIPALDPHPQGGGVPRHGSHLDSHPQGGGVPRHRHVGGGGPHHQGATPSRPPLDSHPQGGGFPRHGHVGGGGPRHQGATPSRPPPARWKCSKTRASWGGSASPRCDAL